MRHGRLFGPDGRPLIGVYRSQIALPKSMGAVAWWDADLSTFVTSSGLIDSVSDFTGITGAATGAAAKRPTLNATGWNNTPAIDYGATGNLGLTTPSMTIGVHSLFVVLQGNATNGYIATQVNDGSNGYLFGRNNQSSRVARSGNTSDKQVSATWLTDGAKHTVIRTFDGTHAGHLLYKDGVDQAATNGAGTANPGTGTVTGAWYLGNNQNIDAAAGIRGPAKLFAIFPFALSVGQVADLHRYSHWRGLL